MKWIIDPIDGTRITSRISCFCVSCLEVEGENAAGSRLQPLLDELFQPRREGTFFNGRRCPFPQETNWTAAFLCTGFPYDVRETAITTEFSGLSSRGASLSADRFCSLDLCYVAAALRRVLGDETSPWDVAAASLMVTEAGGTVTISRGSLTVSIRGASGSNGLSTIRMHDRSDR